MEPHEIKMHVQGSKNTFMETAIDRALKKAASDIRAHVVGGYTGSYERNFPQGVDIAEALRRVRARGPSWRMDLWTVCELLLEPFMLNDKEEVAGPAHAAYRRVRARLMHGQEPPASDVCFFGTDTDLRDWTYYAEHCLNEEVLRDIWFTMQPYLQGDGQRLNVEAMIFCLTDKEQIMRSLREWCGPLRYKNGIVNSFGHPDVECSVKITAEVEAIPLPGPIG